MVRVRRANGGPPVDGLAPRSATLRGLEADRRQAWPLAQGAAPQLLRLLKTSRVMRVAEFVPPPS